LIFEILDRVQTPPPKSPDLGSLLFGERSCARGG
jgi:hypothetical protein